ncbi:tRNA N6-adenosine threonylcarbamoyltransferase, mitochondrial isoform X4 [Panulirus ornatus]|uniref:tRNA N6-adenosine threonylcarbamoyltransferase, mitochondrial isoform X4 n=1 Tax=Panulirus ornatus TaxID=150431 RepID=UPI003A849325
MAACTVGSYWMNHVSLCYSCLLKRRCIFSKLRSIHWKSIYQSRCRLQGVNLIHTSLPLIQEGVIAAAQTTFRGESSQFNRQLVLGIETSCDDTGAAVIDDTGKVLGEALRSQKKVHIRYGGIIPPVAQRLHEQNICQVVNEALEKAKVTVGDLNAVATTVKPGLPLSLAVGTKYGKNLALSEGKPFIPIHHMEAHALTVRMIKEGARRLKLRNIPECASMSGGQAIEYLASKGDPHTYEFPTPMGKYRDCSFSFAGLKHCLEKLIRKLEKEYEVEGGNIIPPVKDVCASFQYAITKHLVRQTQRAMVYADIRSLLPKENQTLVMSGGVACNHYIQTALQKLCDYTGYQLLCPPPKLCTDNGIMIAWNGMERWKAKRGVLYDKEDIEAVDFLAKCPVGEDLTNDVRNLGISKQKWVKF